MLLMRNLSPMSLARREQKSLPRPFSFSGHSLFSRGRDYGDTSTTGGAQASEGPSRKPQYSEQRKPNMTINREKELEAASEAVNQVIKKLIDDGYGSQDLSNALFAYALSIMSLHHTRETLSMGHPGGPQMLQSFIRKTGVHPFVRKKLEIPLKNSGVLNDQQKGTATTAWGHFSLCAKPSGET
jgi:hypothetical protein